MDYLLHLLVFISIYTILAQSLTLFSGFTGLISLAHAGFYGTGAYTAAIFSTMFSTSIFVNFILAFLFSGILAYGIAYFALRSYEDYFVIVTLGVQVVIFSLMNNLVSITNGPLGIAGIPNVVWLNDNFSFAILSVFCACLVYLLVWRLSTSVWGMNLKGINDDEVLMCALGKNVSRIKIKTFVLSASIASIAGVLYSHYISYIDPSIFTVDESIFVLSIVIIGGRNSIHGAFFAACFLVLLPELLRFVGLPSILAANLRQMIYGLLIVFVIFYQEFRSPTKL